MRKDTKAQDFSKSTKAQIAERDSVDGWTCCINCGKPAPPENMLEFSNAHYIPRAQGGLGICENGLTLCPACHRKYDQSPSRSALRDYFRDYLTAKHPGWDETKLYYRRH